LYVALFTIHASAYAKGRTVRIVITADHLVAAIEATDDAVGRFGIWEGPGVNGGGLESKGFIAEWSKGIVGDRRHDLDRYTVSFYEGCKFTESSACHSEEASLAYVVLYEYDPLTGHGYVYLPGKGDEWYQLNVRSIYRRFEGNWFIANDDWQSFVLPLIGH
jgi:hypothetical protein